MNAIEKISTQRIVNHIYSELQKNISEHLCEYSPRQVVKELDKSLQDMMDTKQIVNFKHASYLVTRESLNDIVRKRNKLFLFDRKFRSLRHIKSWIKNHISTFLIDIRYLPPTPLNYISVTVNVER